MKGLHNQAAAALPAMVTHAVLFRLRSNQPAGFTESAVSWGFRAFAPTSSIEWWENRGPTLDKIRYHRSSRKA
jgi:hypothetical protein